MCSVLAYRVHLRAAMPKLPTARQSQPGRAHSKDREIGRQSLTRAFLTFTQAAGSLEKSYVQLQAEVARLRADLECANADLSRSLQETSSVRAFLGRILEDLPCGVLVTDEDGNPRLLNPEGRRLLELDSDYTAGTGATKPAVIADLLSSAVAERSASEQEWRPSQLETAEPSEFRAPVSKMPLMVHLKPSGFSATSAMKSGLQLKREAAKRAHALAEIATVLAHEIRNPLASMELFAGLLAGVTEDLPEAKQWTVHLQAGLRSLSATVNNVLQFHAQPSLEARPVDNIIGFCSKPPIFSIPWPSSVAWSFR